MAKVLDIFSSIFTEEKNKKNVKSLKVFYDIDINIKKPAEVEEQPVKQEPGQEAIPQEPVPTQPQPTATVPPAPPAQSIPAESFINKAKKIFLEDEFTLGSNDGSYIYKREGILSVPKEEYENIQTLDDLLDFISGSKDEEGKQILDEAAVELILTLTGISATPLEDIIKKEDRVIIDINYGNKVEDSIGFKVLKRDGANNLSIVMKKNNEILNSKFDLKSFNSQILEFRNEIVSMS